MLFYLVNYDQAGVASEVNHRNYMKPGMYQALMRGMETKRS